MTRRRVVALASGIVILAVFVIVTGIVVAVTQTEFGRERIRRLVQARASSGLRGKGRIFIGRLSGSMVGSLTIDSIAVRDEEDSLFVATGPIHVTYDARDLFDQRLHLQTVEITRPNVYLRRHADDVWNYKRIFASGKKSASRTRGIGDYIVADSVVLRDGTFTLTEPWRADDSLKDARRDSAVRYALARPIPEVRITKEGPKRTRRWTHLELASPWVRIAHPDSVGQLIAIGAMSVTESDPPTALHDLRGTVRIHGDSVWVALSHFDLPATTGHATALIWREKDGPSRLDLHAVADSVSLRDFGWVYPNLPRVGGGRTEVMVRTDPKNLRAMDFKLKNMDLRTERSRLRGEMTFASGWPVLVVKDVDVTLEPADFDLLRALNGGPLGVDFQGRFTGLLRGPGGRIDAWRVDSADLTFRDAHVAGAVSHLVLRGEVDLLSPAEAKFHGMNVSLDALDLRTITNLFPNFPRLAGTITGSATLDSIWTDVRFHDADLAHHDGPAVPSHVTGSGRVTSATRNTIFDVALAASPLSFTSLARSYPGLPFRGPFSGSLRVQGTQDHLALTSRLSGEAGVLTIDELIDMDSSGGMGARGTVRGDGVDAARLFDRSGVPTTKLWVAIANDVHGDSIADLRGSLAVTVDTSRLADIWVPHGTARINVADGHLHVDSLTLTSTALRVRGSGMLGLAAGARDTLHFTADIDSLGGLRSLIAPRAPGTARDTLPVAEQELLARARRDSLDGQLTVAGTLTGSIADSFTARATFEGERIVWGEATAARLSGAFDLATLPRTPVGSIWARLEDARVADISLDTVHLILSPRGMREGDLTVALATAHPAGSMRGGARLSYAFSADTARLTLDTLSLFTGDHLWQLAASAHLVHDGRGDALDSLLVNASGGGRFVMHLSLPAAGPIQGLVVADSLPLADLGAVMQTARPLAGYVAGDARLTGTRGAPVIHAAARFRGAGYGTLVFPYFTFDADYVDRRLTTRADFFDRGQAVANFGLALPADLALTAVDQRFPDQAIAGHLSADSVNLAMLSSMSPLVSQPLGTGRVDLTIAGTTRQPTFTGRLRVKEGAVGFPRFGVRLSGIEGDVRFVPGGFRIDTLWMRSGSATDNFMSVTGSVRAPNVLDLLTDRHADTVDLHMRAKNFQILDSRRLARVEITDDITLRGPFRSATLTGRIAVDKADFYLTDLSRKSGVVDLDDPELFQDSAVLAGQVAAAGLPPDVREALRDLRVEDLDLTIGDKVWLRSEQSEIKLGGAVQITGSGTQRLTGRIDVDRGSYRLDLGLVQRTFQVDSGSVAFYGDADRSGQLDIWATNVVRQANRQGEDIRILAHITGTTAAPHAEFSSSERVALSQTEILSYLVFGQPSFFGANDVQSANALSPAARALLPSLGAVMEGALSSQLRFVDQITIQTGSAAQSDANAVLAGSRFGIGKQIGDRTYVSANAGLCWLQSSAATNSFSQSLAFSVEHRLGDRLFVQGSMEPSSASLLCKPGSDIGSRPKQYGFDLFREWSF